MSNCHCKTEDLPESCGCCLYSETDSTSGKMEYVCGINALVVGDTTKRNANCPLELPEKKGGRDEA